jgi:uncharacterized protein YjiS (DUF1127 family)
MSSATTRSTALTHPARGIALHGCLQIGWAWLCLRIAAWRRRSHDRAALSRMNIRQLDDLPIEWPEDLRHIRRS